MNDESSAEEYRKHVSAMTDAAQVAESALVGWRLKRMREALAGPLAVVAAGGSHAAAMFWARLHEDAGFPAWAVTPYDLVSRPLPVDTNVLLLSMSGRHHDMLAAARFARAHAKGVFAAVGDRSAPMCGVIRERDDDADVLVVPRPETTRCLVEQWGVISMLVLALETYGHSGPWASRLEVSPVPPPGAAPEHVYCIGAGLGAPAADDFARLLQESDIARASAHDVRDFAHGNFLPAARPGSAVALFAHGAQRAYAAQVSALLSPHFPVWSFEDPDDGPAGGAALMALSRTSHAAWADHFERHPVRADVPKWAVALYHLPFD